MLVHDTYSIVDLTESMLSVKTSLYMKDNLPVSLSFVTLVSLTGKCSENDSTWEWLALQ